MTKLEDTTPPGPLALGSSEGLGPAVADIQAAMRRFADAHTMLGNRSDRDNADEALCAAINAYKRAAVAAEQKRLQRVIYARRVTPASQRDQAFNAGIDAAWSAVTGGPF